MSDCAEGLVKHTGFLLRGMLIVVDCIAVEYSLCSVKAALLRCEDFESDSDSKMFSLCLL